MAARYRRVCPRIWTDEKFRRLTPEQQRIVLYILTAQSNRIGLFSFSPGKACEDLGTLPPTFQKGFRTVCQALNWSWDAEARVLYLPTWWKYNHPENANNMIGNLKDLNDLPDTTLLERFSSNTTYLSPDLVETFTQTLAKRYPQRSPKHSPSQYQYQEQEQEQESPLPPKGQPASPSRLTPEEIRQRWNCIPGVKPCRALGDTIRDRLRTRLREHPESTWWDELFKQVGASDFLTGRTNGNRGPFHAPIDWILRPANLDKLQAGNYDNPEQARGPEITTCTWPVLNGDGRRSKPCGQPIAPDQPHPVRPFCPQHLAERRRIDARLAHLEEPATA